MFKTHQAYDKSGEDKWEIDHLRESELAEMATFDAHPWPGKISSDPELKL